MTIGSGNVRAMWWIMGLVASLVVLGVGSYLNASGERYRTIDERMSTAEATLAARGERISILETKTTTTEIAFEKVEAHLEKIDDKLGRISVKLGVDGVDR